MRRSIRAYPAKVGKIDPRFFRRSVASALGKRRREVVASPAPGVDVGAIRLGRGKVLVATTDPLYVEPALGWEAAAWLAFHIIASDMATSGLPPDYFAFDLTVPPETPDAVISRILRVLGRESGRYGAQVVTGHTGRYEASHFPMVGSGMAWAIGSENGFVTTRSVRAGHRLLLAGPVALEAALLLAYLYPRGVEQAAGVENARALRVRLPELSPVDAALALVRSVGIGRGGVGAMHDVAEGGVRRAVWETAEASNTGFQVDLSRVYVDPAVSQVCAALNADPLSTSSQGALLVAASPRATPTVASTLRATGLVVTDLGQFTPRRKGRWDGGRRAGPPPPDGFWPALLRARARSRTLPRR